MRRLSSSSSNRTPMVKRRSSSLGFDEFGFALSKKREQKLQHRSHEYSYPQPDAVRVKQLCELLSYWNGSSFICRSQIERFIRMGIPPSLRGRVWKCLLNLDSLRESGVFNYQACLDEIRKPLVDLGVSEYSILSALSSTLSPAQASPALAFCSQEVALFHQIAQELKRSFPTHRSLMGESPEAIEGQAKLFRVLTVYAKYNPQIGYSQGMSCIAAVLLMHLSEEEAFWALVVLLREPKYLSEFFDLSSEKIQHQAAVFHQLLKHTRPSLSQHMEDCGGMSLHYVHPWFLALFTSLPCWDSVLAIWDLVMLQGLVGVFRAGLAIISLLEPRLMALTDHTTMLTLLLRVPVELSKHHVLVTALWATEIQESEVTCMANLVLENAREDLCKENLKPNCTSLPTAEPEAHKTDAKTPALAAKEPTKEATGSVTKNVFTRMLRVARRYLVVVGQSSGSGKPSCSSSSSSTEPQPSKTRVSASLPQAQIRAKRRSQKGPCLRSLSRKKAPSSQESDAGATEDCSEPGLRRLKSGPAGRGARQRSVHKALRRRSLQLCPMGSPRNSSHRPLLTSTESPQPARSTTGHYRQRHKNQQVAFSLRRSGGFSNIRNATPFRARCHISGEETDAVSPGGPG
ncbi:TBC1 domain family member 10A isoform X1 [Alosa sapidissima]|uniref:TBC1 domain family member 10A isoform X1 n=1 Tax=Alosa sapidissima TaxID=34773 RepID=UPI001C08AD10|nr:TBC1 domain family member 10A isoform X1 [Alosa sapidissima]